MPLSQQDALEVCLLDRYYFSVIVSMPLSQQDALEEYHYFNRSRNSSY